ncbi:hypothetical protein [Mucilaginibacter sp.]|uniref:Abi-alpha family protein n=1 Tax=Mucilaginibacter sp. TaxID=1882438 RepID=UPI0035BBDC1D
MENEKLKVEVTIPGVSDLGEATGKAMDLGIDAVKGFLTATCKPILQEFGLFGKDIVREYRVLRAINFVKKAQAKIQEYNIDPTYSINPKLALTIFENASLEPSEELQELWAGLYAKSLSPDGTDDEAIMYIDTLKKLTASQLKLLLFASKIPRPWRIEITEDEIKGIMALDDFERIKREVFNLRSQRLLGNAQGIMQQGDSVWENYRDGKISIWFSIYGQGLLTKCGIDVA